MIIRQATVTDVDEIAEVERICFPAAEAASKHTFEERIAAFPDSFLLAVEDGQAIGFVNGCVTDDRVICDDMFKDTSYHKPDGDFQAVFGFAVIPEYRKRGIAAQLMRALIERTRARGKKGLILTCKEPLIGYYSTYGYKNMGVSASVHGGAVWYDMLLMIDDSNK